jgi:hypothetical protein
VGLHATMTAARRARRSAPCAGRRPGLPVRAARHVPPRHVPPRHVPPPPPAPPGVRAAAVTNNPPATIRECIDVATGACGEGTAHPAGAPAGAASRGAPATSGMGPALHRRQGWPTRSGRPSSRRLAPLRGRACGAREACAACLGGRTRRAAAAYMGGAPVRPLPAAHSMRQEPGKAHCKPWGSYCPL